MENECDSRIIDRLGVTETRLKEEVHRQPQQHRMNGKGRREDIHQAMKFKCVNVRGWGIGKFDDACKELNEWKLDVVGMTETHLRDEVRMYSSEYVMIGKGRKT